MAFLDWRRFNFFELKQNVDSGKLSEALSGATVNTSSSGKGHFVLGDSDGVVHLISQKFEARHFRAYDRNVKLIEQSKQRPFLVTIGEDEPGINPVIKVWDISKNDKHGNPVCLRISRASIPNKAVMPSCLTINDNFSLMAIGFEDGSILIYRGDITRERTSKQKLLKDGLSRITGLAFKESEKNIVLFVATCDSIEMYDVTHKDKEQRVHLDDCGCDLKCSVLAESLPEIDFMVATKNAVYCYTNSVRGPCYAVDGEKIQVEWFRSYLVIIAKDNKSLQRIASTTSSNMDIKKDTHILTVLDIQNHFIVFTAPVKTVSAVLIEFGSLYILSADNSMSHIAEKDLQSKLALLFKKNLYDVAIRMAKRQQYDAEGLVEIFKQYGDYLYSKNDHKGAVEQYIKTIGRLEASYVIRKYLESQQVENLTTYLQALHKEGKASGDHTTLLLNCYTKLNKPELLKEFIMTKDREVDFDVEVAIEVCRHVSAEDALILAEKHGFHSWYLTIQIEDQRKYNAALDYIGRLEFNEAEYMMKKYGITLLENIPEETTQFLIKLCTGYRPSNHLLVDQNMLDGLPPSSLQKSNPEEFIHYFFNNSERLVQFLEHLIQTSSKWSSQVYTTLLEHYIHIWSLSKSAKMYEQKIMRLLESLEASYDKLQALLLCKEANFTRGLLHLYEQNKMYETILRYHVAQKDYESVLVCCRRFGNQKPDLWVQALWALVPCQNLPKNVLDDILTVIEKGKLLSPLLVIDALSHSPNVDIGAVRNYLYKVFQAEVTLTDEQRKGIEKYSDENKRLQNTIKDIESKPITFQGSRCSTCNKALELPSVHFLCQHSFHKHCIQGFAENENECPACLPKNKPILDAIKSKEQSRNLHEDFHSQLETSDDPFSLITDYVGRGVFTKLTNYSLAAKRAEALATKSIGTLPYGRVKEEKTYGDIFKHPHLSKDTGISQFPKSEDYNSFLEANIIRKEVPTFIPLSTSETDQISSSLLPSSKPVSNNPFEDDDSMNPFVSENSTNPFEGDEEDDYDRNLNPFAS